MENTLINTDLFSQRYFELKKLTDNDEYLNSLNIDELKKLLEETKDTQQVYKNLELIVKRDANSLYGTSGSIYFSLGDFDLAEDITTSGKHSGVIVDIAINEFFKNWGEIELNIIKEFYPSVTKLRQFTEYKKDTINDLCVYGDTDSRYIDLGKIYSFLFVKDEFGYEDQIRLPENSHEGNTELANFSIFLMEKFINNVIKITLDKDIEYRGANKGFLKMSHEVTTRKCVFQAKKKYVMSVIWKDGKLLNSPNMKVVGVELKKGELNKRIKKIIKILVDKFMIEDYSEDQIRIEILKIIKYIKQRAEKDFIYKITSVSGLKNIYKNEKGIYVSTKNHIQIKIALFWYNFIEQNNLQQDYQVPFEGQKMYYYHSKAGYVVGIPDDIDLNKVPGLPEPDWNKMLNAILVKTLLKYISDEKTITDKDVQNFLINVKKIKFD
jgi:hypothetical protein